MGEQCLLRNSRLSGRPWDDRGKPVCRPEGDTGEAQEHDKPGSERLAE